MVLRHVCENHTITLIERKNQAEASSGSTSDHFKRQMIIGLLVISSHIVWLIWELIFQSKKREIVSFTS